MSTPCRFCAAPLTRTFVDLGTMPLSNAFLSRSELDGREPVHPLHAFVCDDCLLVQIDEFEPPERIFSDYVYFSSYSDSWLAHASAFADASSRRFSLDAESLVIEVASNDGYLLQYFQRNDIPVLGIEPAANVADVAIEAGIETIREFFGVAVAERLRSNGRLGDLIVGNNVLAHVPDINDFVGGLKRALAAEGVLCLEFPHLLDLIEKTQFDTIYHEHFSYLSLLTVRRILDRHGLTVFDVDRLPTHGGSLRVYAQHSGGQQRLSDAVATLLAIERAAGLDTPDGYSSFSQKVQGVRSELQSFLVQARTEGKSVVGYGAPAKGNTLLNFCGVNTGLIAYTVDRSPHKQSLYLPGTHLPVHAPERIAETRPDYILILPWNLTDEIVGQMGHVRDWGGRFVVPIPKLRVF